MKMTKRVPEILLLVFFVISTIFSFMTLVGNFFNDLSRPVYETMEKFYIKMLEDSPEKVEISFPQIKEMPKIFNLHLHEIWALFVLPLMITYFIVKLVTLHCDI